MKNDQDVMAVRRYPLIILSAIIFALLISWYKPRQSRPDSRHPRPQKAATDDNKHARHNAEEGSAEVASQPTIEPLRDFRWSETEPLAYRPFKPRYHLTMGE